MRSQPTRPRWWRGLAGLASIATVVVIATILVINRGGIVAGQAESPNPSPADSSPIESTSPTPATSSPGASGATVRTSGVWYSEVSYGEWVAGRVGQPGTVPLPAGQIPIAGAADLLVSVERTPSDTALTVISLDTGKPVLAAKVPFNVGTAEMTPSGDRLFITGSDRDGSVSSDPGVLEVDLATGELIELVKPLDLLPEWEGQGGRGLSLSPSGATLATNLCGGPATDGEGSCLVQSVDLASGKVRDAFGPITSFLVASTDSEFLTAGHDGLTGLGLDGQELWMFKVAELRGPVAAADDGFYVAYTAPDTVAPTRLARLDSGTGQATDVVVGQGEQELSVWPQASDRHTVIFAEAPLMEFALGTADAVPLRAIDVSTDAVKTAGTASREG